MTAEEAGTAAGAGGAAPPHVLVIGFGNTLRRDDGVGAVAAERMAADPRFTDVEVRAAHQLLPEMAADMAGRSLVIFVDADRRARPGSVEVRGLAAAPRTDRGDAHGRVGASTHHVGGAELVALAQQLTGARPDAASVGIGVADTDLGEGLSPPVEAALPRALDAVLTLIGDYDRGTIVVGHEHDDDASDIVAPGAHE